MFEYYKKRRPSAKQKGRRKEPPSNEELFRLYVTEGYTMDRIAEMYGVSCGAVIKWMRKYGIQARNPRESARLSESYGRIDPLKGRKLPEDVAEKCRERLKKATAARWANGRKKIKDRYGYIYAPVDNGKRRPEHDLIVEEILGRPLLPDECVHHINGIKDDNRPENLAVMTYSEHGKLHSRLLIDSGKHHLVKLSIEQVLEIRNSNDKLANIAKKYVVTIATVEKIRKRRTWKNIK